MKSKSFFFDGFSDAVYQVRPESAFVKGALPSTGGMKRVTFIRVAGGDANAPPSIKGTPATADVGLLKGKGSAQSLGGKLAVKAIYIDPDEYHDGWHYIRGKDRVVLTGHTFIHLKE